MEESLIKKQLSASSNDKNSSINSMDGICSGQNKSANNTFQYNSGQSNSSDTNNFHPEVFSVIKMYDQATNGLKTLIFVCWELKAYHAAKIIIERIIENRFNYYDALDDYLSRDRIKKDLPFQECLAEYLNRKDSFGIAPLHITSHNGDMEMLQILLANGSDPYIRTDEGLTVMHTAAEGDAVHIIYYLKEKYNMSVNERDYRNSTPLHWSIFEGNEIAATYLLAWGADIDAQDDDGHTPLHLSVDHAEKEANSRLAKILLIKGADRSIKNNEDKTPIEIVGDNEMSNELKSVLSPSWFLSWFMIKAPLQ